MQTANTKALQSYTLSGLIWGLSLIDLDLSNGKFSILLDQAIKLANDTAPNKVIAKEMLEIAGCFTAEEVKKELLRKA